MDGHSLIEVAHMLYEVCLATIHGKRGLSESPGEFCLLNSARERRLRDLIQRLAHIVISLTFSKGALMPMLVVVLLFVGERLAGRGL